MIVTVITPDSAGSKGDEAMVRGMFEVFSGCRIRILTTERADRSWSTELPDYCGSFDEVIVPFGDIASAVNGEGTLVVLGADVIDGTCGVEASLSRIAAIRRCIDCGDRAFIFMSFRSDVDQKIIDAIKNVTQSSETRVRWFCRDSVSASNFEKQTGFGCERFPDFAYYCKSADLGHSAAVIREIGVARNSGRSIVGINFCHSSFSSFHAYSEEGIADYVGSVFSAVNEIFEDVFFCPDSA